MTFTNKFPELKLKQAIQKKIIELPLLMGNEAVNFFVDSFTKGGFTDLSFAPWERLKSDRPSHLTQSAALKRSIRISGVSKESVTIAAGDNKVAYAQIHNEGGILNVPVTPQMRKFFWAMYFKNIDVAYKNSTFATKTKKGWSTNINKYKKFSQSAKASDKWRGLALTKKTELNIKIPKRQYMGDSFVLRKKLRELVVREINKAI